jgi:hypothetical protein
MATTTPNYAWVVPTSSDLVKNGATAIETLGDSADQSLWNSGYGQAGKNKIINGDFRFNQRNFTSITSTNFGFDRWSCNISDGTVTYTPQTFTPGAAPVAGYEAINFARVVTTGQTLASARTNFNQNIEDVRTLAGQTATISFWAKAGSGTPKIAVELNQSFGTGGSPSSGVPTYAGQVTLSTLWARYSVTVPVPSISGKTMGTDPNTSALQCNLFVSAGSNFNSRTGSLGIQSNTFDVWGVQVEYGSYATPFQTASGGSIAGELAMCQRYYYRKNSELTAGAFGIGQVFSITQAAVQIPHPVTMRATPTLARSGLSLTNATQTRNAVSAISSNGSNVNTFSADFTTTGIVAGNATTLVGSGTSTTDYIEASAEI